MDTQYILEKAWKVYSINGDIKVVLLLNWKVFNENFFNEAEIRCRRNTIYLSSRFLFRQCPIAHLNRYFLWGASLTHVISVKCRIRTVYFARVCNTNYTIYFNPVNNFDWQLKQKMRSLKQKFGPEHIFVHFPGFWQLESLGRQEELAAVQCLASKSAIMNSFPTGIGYFFLIAENPTVTLYWTSQACFYTKSELSKELDWPNSWQIQN